MLTMSKQFDKCLEDATSAYNIETNWAAILNCVDMIRSHDVSVKDACTKIDARLKSSNRHVVRHSIALLDTCTKNCGSQFYDYFFSNSHLQVLAGLLLSPYGKIVSKEDEEKLLKMIQAWHRSFGQKYPELIQIYSLLKASGFSFPPIDEKDIMFTAQCAPDWINGRECFRCRREFTFLRRKHHCRACGHAFCDGCSPSHIELPQFGIERKVRVCDGCVQDEVARRVSEESRMQSTFFGNDQLKEAEDLQLALALSRSEAESHLPAPSPAAAVASQAFSEAAIQTGISAKESVVSMVMPTVNDALIRKRGPGPKSMISECSIDSRLARYLDPSYWQRTLQDRKACKTADEGRPDKAATVASSKDLTTLTPDSPGNDEISAEMEGTRRFCEKLEETYDRMDTRMRTNCMRGRPIADDAVVHQLFTSLVEMHGELSKRMRDFETSRTDLEMLQDLSSQIHDCRQAVNALRDENERARQEAVLRAQRLRQEKMQQTLASLRVQKQKFLLDQRRIALERFQESENLTRH